MFDETLISRLFIILCCFNFPPMDVLVNVDITWAFITGKQNTFLELKNNKSSIFMWFSRLCDTLAPETLSPVPFYLQVTLSPGHSISWVTLSPESLYLLSHSISWVTILYSRICSMLLSFISLLIFLYGMSLHNVTSITLILGIT